MSHQQTVYLVDPDPQDRHALAFQLGNLGVEAWPFASGTDFLEALGHLRPECVILSMEVPQGGLQLMSELLLRGIDWPVIALSRGGDVRAAVEAMKLGACDFLARPFEIEALLAGLALASLTLKNRMESNETRELAEKRVACLTARELDISLALSRGYANKTVAHELGISVRTVEAHRSNVMMKLGVRSLPELVLLLTRAGLSLARDGTEPSFARSGLHSGDGPGTVTPFPLTSGRHRGRASSAG
jgi:two-component system response regulator FixJ